jgi:hypothetical protein
MITLTITAEDENDYRRQICRLAVPYFEGFNEAGGFKEPEPEAVEPSPPAEAQAPAPEPKKGGRPRGSTNKPKANGAGAEPPQTELTTGEMVDMLSLAEQIQIITDAAHDQPDKFKPLLVPLRDKLGVQYVSKATEKDRPVLQEFISAHGLAV